MKELSTNEVKNVHGGALPVAVQAGIAIATAIGVTDVIVNISKGYIDNKYEDDNKSDK